MAKKAARKKSKVLAIPIKKPSRTNSGSLIQPSAMGGIIGGKGYDFQSRYIVCHIPKWLLEDSFKAILHEGTGDVDVFLSNGSKDEREHIQVKDHAVNGASELREIIEAFVKVDSGMPHTYNRFTLACPSIGGPVQALNNALVRLRNVDTVHYASAPQALDDTKAEVLKRIATLDLAKHSSFILEKVHFHLAPTDFHDDDVACGQFALNLLAHPAHRKKLLELVKPVYSPLLAEVNKHRGKFMDRATLQALIEASLATGGTWSEDAVHLDVHNWVSGNYGRSPDHVVDWTHHFNRSTREVPDLATWNGVLLPELTGLHKGLSANATRLISMRGKSTLSTGVALGAVFPQVGGWVFEIDQPPAVRPWRSNAPPRMQYRLTGGIETLVDSDGDSIALVLNVKGSATAEVEKYLSESSIPVKAIVSIAPEGGSGALSITDDRDAMSVALAARNQLGSLLEKHQVRVTHLFYFGPFALAAFFGQLLTSVGRVHLYEFKDPGYAPSFILRT